MRAPADAKLGSLCFFQGLSKAGRAYGHSVTLHVQLLPGLVDASSVRCKSVCEARAEGVGKSGTSGLALL